MKQPVFLITPDVGSKAFVLRMARPDGTTLDCPSGDTDADMVERHVGALVAWMETE